MSDVGPPAFSVLVHAITSFGVGGILGGLAMTWWQRRGVVWTDEPEDVAEEVPGSEPADDEQPVPDPA
jgi:hypothetical protein